MKTAQLDAVDSAQVSAISVIDLARALYQQTDVFPGFSAANLIDIIGAENFALSQQLAAGEDVSAVLNQRLPEAMLIGLWQLAQNHGSSAAGFAIGAEVNHRAQGLLAHWIKHCQTLYEAFTTFCQHIGLLNASECWQLSEVSGYGPGKSLCLSFHFSEAKNYPAVAVQRSLASIKSWAHYFSGEELQLQAVLCQQNLTPQAGDIATSLFNCPVFDNADRNALIMDIPQANKPLLQANQFIADTFSQQIDKSLKHAYSIDKSVLQAQIMALFEQDIACFNQIEAVAKQLNISRTTLYRRLKNEGVNFSQLLTDYRCQQYRKWRNQGKTDALWMAEKLGFNDISSYYKARKSW